MSVIVRSQFPYINEGVYAEEMYAKVVPDGLERGLVDGDTIKVQIDGVGLIEEVRFLGIDTPETDKEQTDIYTCTIANINPPEAMKATKELATLVAEGNWVYLLVTGRDKYNRYLALVFNEAGTVCMNYEMLTSGHAPAYLVPRILNSSYWNQIDRATREEIPEIEARIEELEAQRRVDKLIIDDGAGQDYNKGVKIGLTWLPISADRISVVEQNLSNEIPLLRAPGSPMIKTGKLSKRIEISANFPSIKYMNEKLRVLIAQFTRSPFLPIENKHIRKMITGNISPSDMKKVGGRSHSNVTMEADYDVDESRSIRDPLALEAKVQGLHNKAYKAKEKEIDINNKKHIGLRYASIELPGFCNRFNSALVSLNEPDYDSEIIELEDFIYELESEYAFNKLGLTHQINELKAVANLEFKKIERMVDKLYDILSDIRRDLRNSSKARARLQKERQSISKRNIYMNLLKSDEGKTYFRTKEDSEWKDIRLMCALQEINVSTIPGFPQNMQATFILDIFNYAAYTPEVLYCKDHIDSLKQAEYYNNLSRFRFPHTAEEAKKYKSSNLLDIKKTDDISESEPFKAYISPLLTGRHVTAKEAHVKLLKDDGSEDDLELSYTFWSPENWLVPVRDEADFSNFSWELEATEMPIDIRTKLRMYTVENDNEYMRMISALSTGLKKELITTRKEVKMAASDALKEIGRLMYSGLQLLGLRGKLMKGISNPIAGTMTGGEEVLFMGKVEKTDGSSIGGKGKWEKVKDVLEFFRSLKSSDGIVTGNDLVNLLKIMKEDEEHLRYGETTRYRFKFKERSDLAITGMSASMRTRMADIPVVSHLMSTKQYMGRSNWELQLNMQTSNENFIEILSELSKKAALSSIVRDKSQAAFFIAKTSSLHVPSGVGENGFTKLIGVNNMLFNGFEYESIPERPGWWNISARFIQSDVSISDFEKILPWTEMYDPDTLDKVIKIFSSNYKYSTSAKENGVTYVMNSMRQVMLNSLFNVAYGFDAPPIPKERLNNKKKGFISASIHNTIPKDVQNWLDDTLYSTLFNHRENTGRPMFSEDAAIEEFYHGGSSMETYKDLMYEMYFKPYKNFIYSDMGIDKDWDSMEELTAKKSHFSLPRGLTKAATTIAAPFSGIVKAANFSARHNMMADRLNRADNQYFKIAFSKTIDLSKYVPEDTYDKIISMMIKQAVVKGLLYDKESVIDFLATHDTLGGATHEEGITMWKQKLFDQKLNNISTGIHDVKLYGSYPDLELPFSDTDLVLPADFYYIKSLNFDRELLRDAEMKSVIETVYNNSRNNSYFYNNINAIRIFDKLNKKLGGKSIFGDKVKWLDKFNLLGIKDYADLKEKIDKDSIKDLESDEVSDILDNFGKAITDVLGEEPDLKFLLTEVPEESWSNLLRYYNQSTQNAEDKRSIFMMSQALKALAITPDIKKSLTGKGKIVEMEVTRKYHEYIHNMQQQAIMSPEDINEWGIYTTYSLLETSKIFLKSKQQLDHFGSFDRTLHLGRAFPAFKFFIIEEDSKEWGMLDDYYMYNAVNSIEVLSAKGSASQIATITLSNIIGNITKKNAVFDKEKPFEDSTKKEQEITSVLLREGTVIKIVAGYDNNPRNLTMIFIGKIVSVQPGPKTTIIAQSFGASLHEKVLDGGYKKFGAFDKPKTHGDVLVDLAYGVKGLSHFGNTSIWEKLGFESRGDSSSYFASSKARLYDSLLSATNPVDLAFSFQAYDPRFENVYLPYTKRGATVFGTIHDFFLDMVKTDSKFVGWTFTWVVKNQSFWDVLTEMSLYRANYITTTLPYNETLPGLSRQTLYFGPKGGFYRYTDLYDHKGSNRQLEDVKKRSDDNATAVEDVINFFKKKYTSDEPFFKFFNEPITMYDRIMINASLLNEAMKNNLIPKAKLTSNRNTLIDISHELDSIIGEPKVRVMDEHGIEQEQEGAVEAHIGLIEGLKKIAMLPFSSAFSVADAALGLTTPFKLRSDKMKKFTNKLKKYLDRDFAKFKKNLFKKMKKHDTRIPSEVEYMKKVLESVKELDTLKAQNSALVNRPVTEEVRKERGEIKDLGLYIKNPEDLMIPIETDKGIEYEIEKGYMPVQQYHYVDSFFNIVENNIRATSEEMFNTVTVNFPTNPNDKETQGFKNSIKVKADDDIKVVKTYVTAQKNIDPSDFLGIRNTIFNIYGDWKYGFPREYIVGYNVLANVMRPMYRGELILIGDPTIKPHDVIFINDDENDMWGPIEVDEVIHRINENGFITVVKPHAIIEPMDPSIRWEIEAKQMFFSMGLGKSLVKRGATMLASAALAGVANNFHKFLPGKGVEQWKRIRGAAKKGSKIKPPGEVPYKTLKTDPNYRLVKGKEQGVKVEVPNDFSVLMNEEVGHLIERIIKPNITNTATKATMFDSVATTIGKASSAIAKNKVGSIVTKTTVAEVAGTTLGMIPQAYSARAGWDTLIAITNMAGFTFLPQVWIPVTATIGLAMMKFGMSLVSWTAGEMLGRECVDVIGLWYKGEPFVAGVDGMNKNTMEVHWYSRLSNLLRFGG